MPDFKFNLQLFADDEGVSSNEPPTDNTDTTSNTDNEPPVDEGNNTNNTILGGAQIPAPPKGGEAGKDGDKPPASVPEKYDFAPSLPEGYQLNEQAAAEFGNIARELNLSNEQANKLAAYGYKFAESNVEQMQQAISQQFASWGEETKSSLGGNFDKTIEQAGYAIEALEKKLPNIRQDLNETGAGNKASIVRAFAMLGELVREDSFRGLGEGIGGQRSIYNNTNFRE